jgi:hypothetical protein
MSRINLKNYMDLPLPERQRHLNLSDSCLEIGASSKENRALLAIHLNTTCHRLGKKTGYLCHACHNAECSNINHLYWGTAKENSADHHRNDPEFSKRNAETTMKRHGEDFYKRAGSLGHLGWKSGKPASVLTEDEVQSRLSLVKESGIDLSKLGWVTQVSQLWGMSHSQVRRFFESHWDGPPPYRKNKPTVYSP